MSDPIGRLNAALEGRYRIERELGEGGMATVYLAEDLRHERKVALKVLKPELAAAVGAERFLAEIRTTANLQHPHVLPLHDSGEADGMLFYVAPYVEGESLADRLARERQLPVEEAVRIATVVAGALDHAHRKGVIHRDIKPANILLPDGDPVLADFGVAFTGSGKEGDRLTRSGQSPGTPQYMSPEQLSGDVEPTPATDTYALAAVLYEMLVGDPPYDGPTVHAVIAEAVTGEVPSPIERRKSVPLHIDAAVRRGLERLPADRFATARDFASALADAEFGPRTGNPRGAAGRRRIVHAAAAVVVTTLVAVTIWISLTGDRAPEGPVVRYSLALPEGEALVPSPGNSLALSPDGETLLYVGPVAGSDRHWSQTDRQLWVRNRRDQLRGRPLSETVGARSPFFSFDGERIAYATGSGQLKVAAPDGGAPVVLVDRDVSFVAGGAWGEDGYIYFASRSTRGLARVPSRGGAPEPVTTTDLGEEVNRHAYPSLVRGGTGVVFTIERNHVGSDIAVLDFRTGEQRVLVQGLFAAVTASGVLVWVQEDGTMLAERFDTDDLALEGEGVVIGELSEGRPPDFAVSPGGRLVYSVRQPLIERVVWVTREGEESVLDPENPVDGVRFLALSPDGSMLAVNTHDAPPSDDGQIFVKQLPDGPLQRLSFEGDVNFRPEWRADGETITFISDRNGDRDVWEQRVDGATPARLVLDGEITIDEARVSRDGRWLVYRQGMQNGQRDIYALRIGEQEVGTPIIDTEFDMTAPMQSPDGRWIAVVQLGADGPQVYVRPFPDADRQWRVSTNGGLGPVWSGDSRELFYRNGNDDIVAVRVGPGDEFSAGPEEVLFSNGPYSTETYHRSWDVTPDGQRFAMIRAYEHEPGVYDVVVVENWHRDLEERLEEAGAR